MNGTALTRDQRMANLRRAGMGLLLPFEQPVFALLFAAFFYLIIASTAGAPWRISPRPYYNLLADAFLHGQLNLRSLPVSTLDLSLYQGKWYLYWGPLPALIILPLVALFGPGVSDVLQTIAFGAFNAALLALLLRQVDRRSFIKLDAIQRALLVLFFTLGSAYTPLPPLGQVWFVAMVETAAFGLLAYLAAFSLEGRQAFFWTGCALAAVMMTRLSAVFLGLFLAWYLLRRYWSVGWRSLAGYCLAGLIPPALALLLLMGYNAARFGSPFETGIAYHQMFFGFREDFARYGIQNIHYLPMNFYYTYIYYPLITLFTVGGVRAVGGSIFLLSPLLFAALYALWSCRRSLDTWALLLTVVMGNVPVLLLMGPTLQFGSRYSVDFLIPLLLLTALGIQRWQIRWVSVLVALSCLQYLIGALMYTQGVLGLPLS